MFAVVLLDGVRAEIKTRKVVKLASDVEDVDLDVQVDHTWGLHLPH